MKTKHVQLPNAFLSESPLVRHEQIYIVALSSIYAEFKVTVLWLCSEICRLLWKNCLCSCSLCTIGTFFYKFFSPPVDCTVWCVLHIICLLVADVNNADHNLVKNWVHCWKNWIYISETIVIEAHFMNRVGRKTMLGHLTTLRMNKLSNCRGHESTVERFDS